MIKLKLLTVAVLGTLVSYLFTLNFIIEMPFWKFFVIEFLITCSHQFYNYSKRNLNQVNPT